MGLMTREQAEAKALAINVELDRMGGDWRVQACSTAPEPFTLLAYDSEGNTVPGGTFPMATPAHAIYRAERIAMAAFKRGMAVGEGQLKHQLRQLLGAAPISTSEG